MKHTLLKIEASANPGDSTTSAFADQFVAQLQQTHSEIEVIERNTSGQMPMIDGDWIAAAYTPEEDRSDSQKAKLALSDQLIAEIEAADEIVLATPMYNFSIPSDLKAWIDMVARAGKTFAYTPEGPRGLLDDKPVTLIVSTGGTPIESPMDFVTPYLRHIFSFIGIHDVKLIAADRMNVDAEASRQQADAALEALFSDRRQAA